MTTTCTNIIAALPIDLAPQLPYNVNKELREILSLRKGV